MNPQLIETVTQMVLKKIAAKHAGQIEKIAPNNLDSNTMAHEMPDLNKQEHQKAGLLKVWDHLSQKPKVVPLSNASLLDHNLKHTKAEDEKMLSEPKTTVGISEPKSTSILEQAVKSTPARVGVGRAGSRPKTETWLRFRMDHAAAVDAVYGEVNLSLLNRLGLISVETHITSKEEFLLRPDLGRRLTDVARKRIMDKCLREPQIQIIISDGLSSQAVETNVEDVFLSLKQSLNHLGLKQGTPFFIKHGRVAVMDDVGELLQPEVVVLLIGERPGLVSAESLSAYLCYKPRRGTIEADRMVISNIHSRGIPPVEAGAYLGEVIQEILKYQASGVSLMQRKNE